MWVSCRDKVVRAQGDHTFKLMTFSTNQYWRQFRSVSVSLRSFEGVDVLPIAQLCYASLRNGLWRQHEIGVEVKVHVCPDVV